MSNLETRCRLLEKCIEEFEAEKLSIHALINRLQRILDNIDNQKVWVDAFRSEWWTLEQVYAVARDRGETSLSWESRTLVHEAIHNMKRLLKQANSFEE
ncbi:hypothetical protein HJG54_34215 [Leptolyngbya sp. NK1-12]|uniref:Uncharacterized protein n=1 Tax=Leptolyngbya sp. NK1-12 TaxID=2547451 RepID=A0AA96WQ90_9CYAN|nr:hypothetical protein [Leptolyngbya sp. NK1-12]WNZ26906.1 hypothetical protein HJG54_28685 [Leptolyngbya sp. NK1-12]WNZ27881.1 hypothetical protein HJG54_34215 [Leptolyngbya sp. NK1-12]